MRRICSSLALVGATMLGFSASASADGGYRGSTKDAPAPFSWTGFYVGLQAGWSKLDDTQDLSSPTFALTVHDKPNGSVLGGHAGYNIQASRIVYGIEVDIEHNTTDSDFVIGSPFANTTSNESLRWQGSVRGRLGLVVDKALLYATGGWAFGGFRDRYDTAGPTFHETVDSTRNGWTLGGGAEFALTNHLTARVEYRFTDWGTHTNHLNVFLSPPGLSKDDVTQQSVRVGVSYKFGP
jgi:outer membrane immunogenic protein